MEQQHANSMWIRAYSPDGFELSLTLAVNSAADAAAQLEAVRAAGFLPRKPEVVDGESEVIETVVRRQTENGVPIIDYYTAWSHENKFGAFKYGHKYLDKPEDVAQFEAQSGLKLADMPLYDGQTAITRKPDKVLRHEVRVKQTFSLKKIKVGQYDDGKPKYEYDYAKPLTVTVTAWTQQEAAEFYRHWIGKSLTQTDIFKALGVKQLGDWKQSAKAAHDAVQGYIEHLTGANQS